MGRGGSGKLYVGVNMELPGLPLNASIHAEQCLITNMVLHGEQTVTDISISAAPCGHCRQFMCELACAVRDLLCLQPAPMLADQPLVMRPAVTPKPCPECWNGARTSARRRHAAVLISLLWWQDDVLLSYAPFMEPKPLSALLPDRFGPHSLMRNGTPSLLLQPQMHNLEFTAGMAARHGQY